MAEIVRMPKLSDTMTEGVVAEWHKQVGDAVESGDLLAEIETDKATMEFESFQDGTLLYIGVETGNTAPVDSILAILGNKGEDVEALIAADQQAPAAVEEEVPAAAPAPAPVVAETAQAAVPSASPSGAVAPVTSANGRVKASPLARRLAEDKGVDINLISGSGDGGRIVKRDVDSYQPAAAAAFATTVVAPGTESFTDEKVSQMRKTITRRLGESKFSAPHFYLTVDIDMDNAIQARKSVNDTGEVKISFNDMVIKAAAIALQKHPQVNSSWMADTIRTYNHIHVGVAVAVKDGLLVPVVRFADNKKMSQIGAEVREYAEKARNKKLQPAEMEGSTFTISNLGMFGIEEFTAIINTPNSCIMAVGAIRKVPVVKDGQVVPGNRMKVTLSCDHRTVDGASGAEYLRTFKQMMENPIMMLA